MSKWVTGLNAFVKSLTTREGTHVAYSFGPHGLRLSMLNSGKLVWATLEPPDALEFAHAIIREYGGRDE